MMEQAARIGARQERDHQMAKAYISFATEEEYEAHFGEYDKRNFTLKDEVDALKKQVQHLLERAASAKPDPYAAFAEYPELHDLLGATNLRPYAMPALCALQVWKGVKTASAICEAIPVTPAVTTGGGVASTKASVARALVIAAVAFLAANKGVGIEVIPIQKSGGDVKARIFRFRPIERIEEVEEADETAAEEAQQEVDRAA
jgi:hypothetical protein